MDELKKLLEALQGQQKKASEDMSGFIAKHEEETEKSSNALAETKENIEKQTAKLAELETEIKEVQQKLASHAPDQEEKAKSIGERVANSDVYKNFVDNGDSNMKMSLDVKALVSSGASSAGALIQPQRRAMIAGDPMDRLMLRDLMNVIPVNSNSVEYAQENVFTNNAGYQTAEGETKPESEITFSEETANLKTTAHFINMSRQSVEDAQMLQTYLETRMIQGLLDNQEAELMAGAGGANAINGLSTAASTATLAKTDVIDRVAEAILAVYNSNYAADAIVMNPVDWFEIQIKKDSNNQYLFANPQGTTTERLWGLPVLLSKKVTAGNFMTGNFRFGAEIYERSSIDVRISDQHKENFTQNLLTLLVEQRIGLGVLRPSAFVKAPVSSS